MEQEYLSNEIIRNWFDQLLKSQGRQEKKLDETFNKIDCIDDRVRALEYSFKHHQETVNLLSQQIWHGDNDKGGLQERIVRSEERVEELSEEIKTLESNIFNRRSIVISGGISGIIGLITFVLGLAFTTDQIGLGNAGSTSKTTKEIEKSTIIKEEQTKSKSEENNSEESNSEESNSEKENNESGEK
jgi:hypothetical protein